MSTRRTALPNLLLPTIERLVRVGLCLALALAGLAAAPAAGSPPVPGRPSVPGGAPGPAPSAITAEQAIAVALASEVGPNDFRISHMGGDTLYDAGEAAVAYNSADHEYLVVWRGDDNTGALVNGEDEIFGQRVDAATGAEIGGDFRISDMGPDGNPAFDARKPSVAYNSQDNEYLVVWEGDDNSGSLVNGEFEIFGQRINAATGAEIGANDFRISDMGPDGDPDYDALNPVLAYNSQDNEYLVVWQGDDDSIFLALIEGEFEIFGQRINAGTGAEIGGDFRISDMGPNGSTSYGAFTPAVAYNSVNNQYLVVWSGDDNTAPLVDGEFEIFGQRINAGTGAEIGGDFRISDMGPNGSTSYGAFTPAVAYNSVNNQYLAVWQGDDNSGGLVDEEYEIFGQRINAATGAEIGGDFRISDMGPVGSTNYLAYNPAVAYNSADNQYLVVWDGDDNSGGLVDEEYEIFGQRINAATGAEIGGDFRISDLGPDGDTNYGAGVAAVAYNSADNEHLVVWLGDDNTGALVDEEFEIFGQRVDAATGAEIGANDFRLSDMGGDTLFNALSPAVAYNSQDHEYLVVWHGDDNTGTLVDGEFEIYGQLVDAVTGAEIGGNFRISDMGPDGSTAYGAFAAAVAYNSADNEYLVVWHGDDNTGSLVDDEREIFGQRLNAATGAEIGANDFRISDMGLDGNTSYGASGPAVAYNSADNEYLVVWTGDDNTGALVAGELEIFGQRLNAATGAEIGANDFRISDMGPDGDPDYDALNPVLAYNSQDNEYLVVWQGDDDSLFLALIEGEFEIFGQRINAATGAEIGANDFRISDMGPVLDAQYDAYNPALAYNSADHEYLVVWSGDDDTGGLVNEEFEIFGQRLDAATGDEIGANDFRISDMGPDGNVNYRANFPEVAYNSADHEYLVGWHGDDNTGGLVDGEIEIFGQRLDAATGDEIGANDFRISDMGPDGSTDYEALNPALAYNSVNSQYLVVWDGDDDTADLVEDEYEIFGQRLANQHSLFLPYVRR